MRVLEAITPSRIGGAEVYVAELCRLLPDLGADVKLFIPSGRPFVDYTANLGIKSINWKTYGKFDPVTIIRLAGLIRKHNIDVVHSHLSTASLLGAWAATLAGKPSVAHVHGLNTATCFMYSTAVIAVSEAVKKHLCSQGLDPTRVHVVHNGVDLSRFRPVSTSDSKRKHGYEDQIPVFGIFGRLSDEKGQLSAVEAMFLLAKMCPSAKLILVGNGKNREDLVASAQALGVANSVEFKGFTADVRGLMSACDAVIVPSLKEGFGLAAVEAMALAKPVIATDIGGLPEIVIPNETGFLVPVNSPQQIAEAMEKLIWDKSLAECMGKAGRERVEECFDLSKQMRAVFSILEEVAG